MDNTFQTIQSVGAKKLVEQISALKTFSHQDVKQSIGDDAAVLSPNQGDQLTLLSTDTYVEGVDFDLTYTPFNHLGYKVFSAAVSDIYAMNGHPVAILINLALPNRISVQMVEQFYKGVYAAGKLHETEVVGGDFKAAHSNMVISISVYGRVDSSRITYRSGAKEGDAICVTGDVGAALAGLRILMREKKYWQEQGGEHFQPELQEYQYVIQRQLMPEARKDIITAFAEHNVVPTAMIDVSKSLISEINGLAEASGLGAYIYQAALPLALETRRVADEMEEDVDRYALFGGEDLELLFTLPEAEVERFVKHNNDFAVIGRMVPKNDGLQMQTAEGEVINFDDLS